MAEEAIAKARAIAARLAGELVHLLVGGTEYLIALFQEQLGVGAHRSLVSGKTAGMTSLALEVDLIVDVRKI